MYYILYNPLSANGRGAALAEPLQEILKGEPIELKDIREVKDYAALLDSVTADDALVIAGGDGTINRFVNDTQGMVYPENLLYFATGSGNDFFKDVSTEANQLIPLGTYIQNLPTVTVKGKTYRFLNGIGYGIDGYCCEVGDEQKRASDKPVNYTSIAIKGLLFHYKPTKATVTVDGVSQTFEKVWLAPSMNGRFYGGGMMIAPEQDRLNPNHTLSLVVLHNSGKLKTLMVFPKIFQGEHVSRDQIFTILTGKEIHVQFDRPVALQIDGETVLDVSEYTASAYQPANNEQMKQTVNA